MQEQKGKEGKEPSKDQPQTPLSMNGSGLSSRPTKVKKIKIEGEKARQIKMDKNR